MKYIIKKNEPQSFTEWKAKANDNWDPIYPNISKKAKNALRQALMVEQGYLCCYCERRITEEDSHIEHFKPQSYPGVDPLDYGNLLCSCQKQLGKGEPRHCGNLKGDWFDSRLLVSPLSPDCEARFSYTGDGGIKPAQADDRASAMTILKLGLGIPKLKALRAKAIEPFLDDELSIEEIRTFVAGYLTQGSNGAFGEFHTTIRFLFGGLVGDE